MAMLIEADGGDSLCARSDVVRSSVEADVVPVLAGMSRKLVL